MAENNENAEVKKIQMLNGFLQAVCGDRVLEGSEYVKQFLTYNKLSLRDTSFLFLMEEKINNNSPSLFSWIANKAHNAIVASPVSSKHEAKFIALLDYMTKS